MGDENKNSKKKKGELVILTKEKSATLESCEKYFFKYAFPCAQAKLRMGSLRQEEYNNLKEIFLTGNSPDKEALEKCFPAAFRRMRRLAEKLGKNIWDMDVLKEYWAKNHNEVIDEGEGMYGAASGVFKELCKINEAEIIEKQKDRLVVKYENRDKDKIRIVSNFLVPDSEVGDKVTIHYGYAIEKIKSRGFHHL